MKIPDCTLVTACYDLSRFNPGGRDLKENIEKFEALLSLPAYLVIFADASIMEVHKNKRINYGLGELTQFIQMEFEDLWVFNYVDKVKENREKYWATRDSRTCAESHLMCCNKFDFLEQIIHSNPFSTSKFGWIDGNLGMHNACTIKICEDYLPCKILRALESTTDKFHIQILNVVDKKYKEMEHKRELYANYRWVMCGSFFTFGKDIGEKILKRLKDIFITTTEIGYGHAEEMFFIEILDEFYDDIHRSYGDYGQIINNFERPTKNILYIYHFILKNYVKFGYWREAYECSQILIRELQEFRISLEYPIYMDILYIQLQSAKQFLPLETTISISNNIIKMCDENPLLRSEFKYVNHEFQT